MEKLYQLRIAALSAAFAHERASFWLLCFYIFLEYVRPQTIYPAIDVIPWAQTAILLTIIFFFLEGNRATVKNPANPLMLLFLGVVLLSSLLAYSPQASMEHLHVMLAWFIVYFLIIKIVTTETKLFLFLVLYLLWNFKMTQHGFLSWASRGFAYSDWGVTGAPGWFHNSGEFGIQLSIFIPLSIYFIHALRAYWGKVKLVILLALPFTALVSVVATSSRGALLGAGAAIAWMALRGRRRLAIAALMVVPLAYGVYKAIPDESMARWQSVGVDNTSLTRLTRWQAGFEIMNDNPVLGVGYANWMPYYRQHYPRETGTGSWGLSHNIFIDAGAELGYVGLGLFIAMILVAFITNRRTRRLAKEANNRFLYYMAHAFDAGMVGFLVSASFVSVLYYPYFWIALAFTVALNNVATGVLQARDRAAVAASSPVRGPRPAYPPADESAVRAGVGAR